MIRFYDFPKKNLKNYHEEDFEKKHNKINLYSKNHDLLYVLLFICFIVSLTVGYTVMQQEFYVSGNAIYRAEKDIRITNFVYDNENSNNAIDGYHQYSVDNFKSEVTLPNLDSKAVYDVTVTNKGTTAMRLKSVMPYTDGTTTYYNNENIDYIITYEKDGVTYTYSETTKPIFYIGTETNIKITFKYKDDITTLPDNTTLTSIIKFEFEEVVSILTQGNDASSSSTFYNQTEVTKENIETISFSPVLGTIDSAIGYWDASLNGDNSVIAYYTDTDENGKYELTITGNGVIHSADNASRQFQNFTSLKSISFNSYFDVTNSNNLTYFFMNCSSLTNLNLSSWDTSNVTYFNNIFNGCKNISEIKLNDQFVTAKATNLKQMFYNCKKLTTVDVSNWDTSEVTNMGSIFYQCYEILELDVSNWNTEKVTEMSGMFYYCKNLENIDVSNWNTSNVTTMVITFKNCKSLTTLNINGWNTSNVTSMSGMFCGCNKINSLDVSNWDTSNVTNMAEMFYDCYEIEVLDVSKWDTTKVTDMSKMFYSFQSDENEVIISSKLANLDVATKLITKDDGTTYTAWDTSNVTNMVGMFYNCGLITNLDVSGWNTSNVTSLENTFSNCKSVTVLNVSGWDTSNVTSLKNTFNNCGLITNLDVSGWNTSNVTTMEGVFASCSNLIQVDVSQWNTSNVTNMYCMFEEVKAQTINVSGFNTSNVIDMGRMFRNCENVTYLNTSNFDTSNVTSFLKTFSGCNNLISLDVSNFNTQNVTNLDATFNDCFKLEILDVSKWNTTNVTTMTHLFYSCRSLASIDVSMKTITKEDDTQYVAWNTENVTDMSYMFSMCYTLNSLNLNNFNTTSVTSMSAMFSGNLYLTSLDLSSFDTTNVTDMSNMFHECTGLTSIDMRNFNINKVTSYTDMLIRVPSNCLIYVNQSTYDFILNNVRTDLTNMQIV